MRKHPLRTLLATLATMALAALGAVAAVPTAASAAVTNTYISLHAVPAPSLAGAPVLMQVYTGSLAGNFPPGEADVSVEGSGMREGADVSTSDGGVQIKIGNFPAGTITVDATFTPTDASTYAPSSTKASFTISPVSDNLRPAFLAAPALGHSTSVVALLFLGSGAPHAPGGVVSFLVGGKSVGSCTPAPTEAVANYSCKATLPAPLSSGKYTVTAEFGRSSYYQNESNSVSATVAAKPVVKTAPKKAPATSASTSSSSTSDSTPAPASAPTSPAPSAPAPITADKTDAEGSTTATGIDPWAWLFVGTLVLLIAGGVVAIIALRRRRA